MGTVYLTLGIEMTVTPREVKAAIKFAPPYCPAFVL